MNRLLLSILLVSGIAGCGEDKKVTPDSEVGGYKITVWGGGAYSPQKEYTTKTQPNVSNGTVYFTDINGKYVMVSGNWVAEEIK